MITFLDEKDIEYGAQVELKVTNGINGEKSISGTIHSNDDVLNNIDKGWRLRFKNEYYVIIYSLPVDLGNVIEVEFDAVHQFFYDFKKSIVHQELNGSNTFAAYIRFIFQDSGYEYRIEGQVNAIEKQSFGFKNRLALFNDIIKSTGSEFQVNGKVVRIMPKVGTDLSTIVKKNFNLNELKIEKNINDFVTYKKGYGAWFDEEDHSKGRLEVEYVGVLMTIYGKIEGEPIIDERYTNAENLKKKLKDEVENSYSISVSMDFEDLTKAGYQYEQPVAGDYIMAINDDLKFREKIRIVSFESHYDVAGNLINHKVTCNDIGAVKKREADYAHMSKTIESQQEIQNKALEIANLALVAANGKNKNYYGTEMPVDKPKGTLIVGDTLFLTIGDRVKRYYWNGSDWIVDPFDEDINYVKNQLTEVFTQVENDRTNTNKAISQALEDAKTEAERLDKERQTIIDGKFEVVNKANKKLEQSIATAEQNAQSALQKAGASEDLAKTAKEVSENAIANLGEVNTELGKVKEQASDSIAKAQEAINTAGTLSTQVKSYEETVDGYKSEVANYSKTNETLTAKVKTYEETIDGYTQSLTRVEGKFDDLQIGGRNYIKDSYEERGDNHGYGITNLVITNPSELENSPVIVSFEAKHNEGNRPIPLHVHYRHKDGSNLGYSYGKGQTTTTEYKRFEIPIDSNKIPSNMDGWINLTIRNGDPSDRWSIRKIKLEKGNKATDWTMAEEDKVTKTEFQTVKESTNLFERTIGTTETNIKSNIAKITMTDSLFQREVGKYSEKPRNLFYDPINLSKYNRIGASNLVRVRATDGLLLRVTKTGLSSTSDTYSGVEFPLSINSLSKGEYSFRIAVWVDKIPDRGFTIAIFDKRKPSSFWYHKTHNPTTTGYQTFTGKFTLPNNVSNFDPMCFQVFLRGNGQIAIGHGVLVNSSIVPSKIYDSGDNFLTSQVTQLSNSWALNLKSGNDIKTAINATTDGIRLKGSLITLDGLVNMTSSFVVPEGNIGNLSAKKITSGTIDTARLNSTDIVTKGLTSNVVKSEHILANEALFKKLFTDDLATKNLATKRAWIKSGMIGDAQIGTAQIGQIDASNGRIINLDASSITSGSMTANRIRGGVLSSTNGATSFDLNTGQLNFLQRGIGITNRFSGRPLQYLTFNSGRIDGSEGAYTALMSNSGNIMNMDKNSAGIQIWNSFAKKTAVNLYGKNITFMRDAADANSIDINTVTKTVTNIEKLYALDIDVVRINGLRITPFTLSGNAGIALLYGDAGLWIGGHGDFAFKSGSGWVGKESIINR